MAFIQILILNSTQITCLFWFESIGNLHSIESAEKGSASLQPMTPDAIPSIGFRKWVITILSTTQVTQNVVLLALLFIYRLKDYNPNVSGKQGSEFRLLTIALMLGNKYLDDNTYTNKTWAEVSGISVQEIHVMEVEFLSNMRYNLFTSESDWKRWHTKLGKFFAYFERSTKPSPTSSARKPIVNTSNAVGPHMLPSPPSGNLGSPQTYSKEPSPVLRSWNNPNPFANPRQPVTKLSPTRPHFPVDIFSNTSRKRSRDEGIEETPYKRTMRDSISMGPIIPGVNASFPPMTSAAAIPPLTMPQSGVQLPRLPLPNLPTPVSRGNSSTNTMMQLPVSHMRPYGNVGHNLNHSGTPTQTPPSLIPHHVAPQQPQSLSQPLPYATTTLLHPTLYTNTLGPGSGPSLDTHLAQQRSPYPSTSSGISPTSATPSAYATPTNSRLSPSFFLSNRVSPYRPVRTVNTLLIPPPSASMHNANNSRPLPPDQMHYYPLGKASERKTGLLPHANLSLARLDGMQLQQHHQTPQPWILHPPITQPNFPGLDRR